MGLTRIHRHYFMVLGVIYAFISLAVVFMSKPKAISRA